jgi:hypothetical protein
MLYILDEFNSLPCYIHFFVLKLCALFSQFTLTIRANDDTLWCMGLSEYDRNASLNPVPVFNDFRVVGSPKEEIAPEAILPFPASKYLLKKGHKRVSMHSNIDHVHFADEEQLEDQTGSARPALAKSFDIVLHKGQAYLLPLEMKFTHADLHSSSGKKIVDYSVGWQHELLLVEAD